MAEAMGASRGKPRFYVWMAVATILIAFGLFAPTYWLQLPGGTFTGSPLLHLHGLLFSAWCILFLSQTLFAASGRIERHRAWGLFGIALATAMVFSGLATSIMSIVNGTAAGHGAAVRAFAIVPVTAMVVFAVLIAGAVAAVKKPEIHKRLMLVATLSILQAPLDRIFFALNAGMAPGLRPGSMPPPPAAATIPSGSITVALILVAMFYDWRTSGRVHKAYLAAGAFVAAAVYLRPPLSTSAAWDAIAGFLARFAV
jgi:uncharacterized membrane protein YozB (DUF420 family)